MQLEHRSTLGRASGVAKVDAVEQADERPAERDPPSERCQVVALTVVAGRIVSVDILADPERLARLDLTAVAG